MGLSLTWLGIALVVAMAWEAFETIVLPRTVSRKFRITSLYYEGVWIKVNIWQRILRNHPVAREGFMSVVGPLSLIFLMALWAFGIILGFAMVQNGLGTTLTPGNHNDFATCLYMSCETFFTLGYGDVIATNGIGRSMSMVEAGTGFGMLALVISYVPVLYQAFSARERVSLLLDARAGSPPVAAELLATYDDDLVGLRTFFAEFERWGATLLETYLSYPVLMLYRSQHEQLSWIASVTCVSDACAFVQVGYQGDSSEMKALQRQAKLTYAMLRHLVVDVAFILGAEPEKPPAPRLTDESWRQIVRELEASNAPVCSKEDSWEQLKELRRNYEPYVYGLAETVFLQMPPWHRNVSQQASWQTTAWDEEKHF